MFAATSEHEANEFMPPMAYKRGRTFPPEPRGLHSFYHRSHQEKTGHDQIKTPVKSVDRYLSDFDFAKKSFPLSIPLDDDATEFKLGNW